MRNAITLTVFQATSAIDIALHILSASEARTQITRRLQFDVFTTGIVAYRMRNSNLGIVAFDAQMPATV